MCELYNVIANNGIGCRRRIYGCDIQYSIFPRFAMYPLIPDGVRL